MLMEYAFKLVNSHFCLINATSVMLHVTGATHFCAGRIYCGHTHNVHVHSGFHHSFPLSNSLTRHQKSLVYTRKHLSTLPCSETGSETT